MILVIGWVADIGMEFVWEAVFDLKLSFVRGS